HMSQHSALHSSPSRPHFISFCGLCTIGRRSTAFRLVLGRAMTMNGRAFHLTIPSPKASLSESTTSISLLNSSNSWPLSLFRGSERSVENGMRSRRQSEVQKSTGSSSTTRLCAIRDRSPRTWPEASAMSRSKGSTALPVTNRSQRGS
ncbi:hypothetical protein HBH99_256590, partial [Parastagonospora nodorum]